MANFLYCMRLQGNFIEVLFKTSIQSGMMKYNPNDSLAEMTVLIAVIGLSIAGTGY